MEADVNKLLSEYVKNMPSLPTSVAKIMEVCNNPQTSPVDLNNIVSLDPVLIGRVLKLINSAYYGLGQHVTSLAKAIIMLGINTVKNLALSTAVMGTISTKGSSAGLEMEGFWRHSLGVGVSAKLLAKKRGIDSKQTEEYFTAGLLHDIGKISINAVLSKEYVVSLSVADKERKPLFLAENNTLGMTHCEAGAMIANAWKLDGAVCDVIVHHHNYEEYSGKYTDVLYSVAAANHFVSISNIGFSGNRHPVSVSPGIWEALNVPPDVFFDLEDTVNKEIEKAKVFLKIGE